MDAQVTKRLGEKRGGDFRLWDSTTRAAKGALGPRMAAAGFDLDATVESDELEMPPAPPSPVTMDDLEQVIAQPELMPPDAELQPLGNRECGLRMAGMWEPVRVTNPAYFEEHAESVELWSPGSAAFKSAGGLGRSAV